MSASQPPLMRRYIAPRYWPTWIGIGALSLLAWMPWSIRMMAGRLMGLALYHFGRDRRYVTETNIRLCFPDLSPRARQTLVRDSFIDNGIGLIETATGWLRSGDYFRSLVVFRGRDVLEQAHARGKGVLLVGAHYSTLDLGARLFTQLAPLACTYRPNKNPLFNAFMVRGRLRSSRLFERRDIRGAFRYLRENGILWYAPDQDYGPDHAVYAPFFGQQAATITATTRFASHNDSAVVVVRHHRLTDRKGYEMEFLPVPDSFPSGDDVADATLINQLLEKAIRQHPSQYLWMHKRFKTQPGGKPQSPYIEAATSTRRMRAGDLDHMTPLPVGSDGTHEYQMPEGLRLKQFSGLARGPCRNRHPARHFDTMARQLRARGIDAVTVGRIYLCRERKVTLVSYYPPPGDALKQLLQQGGFHAWQALGDYLGRFHQVGFRFRALRPEQLYWDGASLQLANPHEVERIPMSLGVTDRLDQLLLFCTQVFPGSHAQQEAFGDFYQAYRADMRQEDRSRLDELLRQRGLFSTEG